MLGKLAISYPVKINSKWGKELNEDMKLQNYCRKNKKENSEI
jgi:hypothetical protein